MMKKWIRKILTYALLLGGAVVFAIPLAWMVSTALKPIEQTMSLPPTWVAYQWQARMDGQWIDVETPEGFDPNAEQVEVLIKDTQGTEQRATIPTGDLVQSPAPRWENFSRAIEQMKYFWRYLGNTVLLCVLTVVGTVFSSALAAYGFSRIDWIGRNRVFIFVLATMMIPFPVIMVPLYCLFRWAGLIGTLTPLWIGAFFAAPFNVFLLRQFFMTIPRDLSDAARMDGCNEWQVLWHIILPLAKPALLVVALFTLMATWNDFLGPLIYLTDQQDFTLALGLQAYQTRTGGTQWHYLMAASTLIILPMILMFFLAQRYFIEGISMTGLKG